MSISNLTLSLSRFCCFLWYGVAQKGFRFYHLKSHRLMVSHPVVFKEYNLFKGSPNFARPLFLFSRLCQFHLQSWCPGRNAGTFGSFMVPSRVSCFNGKLPAISTSTKRNHNQYIFLFEYIIINFQKLDRTSKMAKRVL